MVHFLKRINGEIIEKVNEAFVSGLRVSETPPFDNEPPTPKFSSNVKLKKKRL